jgi:hypothetical protein
MIGNVHGRKNWFYRLCRIAEAGDSDMSYHRLNAYDAVRGGVMEIEEVEAARRDFVRLGKEGIFRQLYMAEAADDGENPFGLDAIRACCEGVEEFSTEHAAAAGVDLAGRGALNIAPRSTAPVDRDFTAISMLDRSGHATHIERFRQAHTETSERIVKVVGRTPALIDSTGAGDPVVEGLQRRGDMIVDGFTFTPRSRQELLEHLALFIGDGDIRWPDLGPCGRESCLGCPKCIGSKLRAELESFEFVFARTGVTWRVPDAMHDDLAMSLALVARRMPWKRAAQILPIGIPSPHGSRWMGATGERDTAYAKYLESQKPTTVSTFDSEETVPAPALITGPGAGKWR